MSTCEAGSEREKRATLMATTCSPTTIDQSTCSRLASGPAAAEAGVAEKEVYLMQLSSSSELKVRKESVLAQ